MGEDSAQNQKYEKLDLVLSGLYEEMVKTRSRDELNPRCNRGVEVLLSKGFNGRGWDII